MINLIVFVISCTFIGELIQGSQSNPWLKRFLGFHLGFGVYMALAFFALFFEVDKKLFIGIGMGLPALYYVVRNTKRPLQLLSTAGVALIVCLISSLVTENYLTTDSYYFILLGESFWHPDLTFKAISSFFNLWGVFGVLSFSPAKLLDLDYFYNLPLLSGLYFVGAWMIFFHNQMKSFLPKADKLWLMFWPAVALGIFFSTFMVNFVGTHIHINLITGQYLCLGLFLIREWQENTENRHSALSVVVLFCTFVLLRMESAIYLCTLGALLIVFNNVDSQIKRAFSWSFWVAAFWYLILGLSLNKASHLVSPKDFLLMSGLLCLTGVFLRARVPFFSNKAKLLLLLALVGHAVLFIAKPSHLWQSDQAVVGHLFRRSYWGFSWIYIMIATTCGFIFIPKIRQSLLKFDFYLVVLFFLTTLSLGALRSPFHGGLGDSANRILVHFFPYALSLATACFALYFHSEKRQIPKV